MGALGDVLELLHRGGDGVDSVRATVRTWEHRERTLAAWDAVHRRRATDAPAIAPATVSPGTIREATGHVWWDRAGARLREEIDEGTGAPRILIRDGDRWWSYDEAWGPRSNDGDPGAPHGSSFTHLFAPAWYLGALRIAPRGRDVVAGRPALIARGTPRTGEDDGAWTLHDLGGGADAYELAVDAEHGVLLRVTATRAGAPFARAEVVEIAFGEAMTDERFAFVAPEGAGEPPPDRGSTEHLASLHELAERLPFPVFALPEEAGFLQLPQVLLTDVHGPAGLVDATRGDGGGVEITLERATRVLGGALDRGDWRDEIRAGRRLRVRDGLPGAQACVRVELDGTLMQLSSTDLGADDLAALAAGLVRVPAPAGSPA